MAISSMPARGDSLRDRVAAEARAWRARLGMSQTALAKAMGMSQAAMSDRLTGKTPFTLDELQALADTFGVDPADLLVRPAGRPARSPHTSSDRRPGPRHAAGRRRPPLTLSRAVALRPLRLVSAGI